MPETTIKAEAADVGAHAGGRIAGNLFRGGTGQFQAGPAAQLQKRLEAIRAKRLAKGKGKKGKAKGRGKAAAKPKATPADKLAARKQKVAANRTAAIAEMANRDAGLAPAGAANLLKLADGGAVEGAGADALVKMGLAEQSKTDDKYRLTAAGRSAAGALGRGDADGAISAVNRAGEAAGKRTARQAEHAKRQAERAKKKGARAKEKVGARAKEKAAAPVKPEAIPKEAAPATDKAPSQEEKAKNRTAALSKMTDKPNEASMAALDALAKGGKADPDMAQAMADETGLVEKGADGSYSVSKEGKRLIDALDKGDADGAASALADGQSKLAAAAQAKPKKPTKPSSLPTGPRRQTATKGNDMLDYDTILDNLTAHSEALAELLDDDGAIKAGARHSGSDNKLIQAIYDSAEDICELAEALGATVVDEADEEADAGDIGESVGHEGAPVEGKAAEEISEETEDALKSTDADSRIGIEFMSDELAVCPGNTVKALADGDDGWTTGLLVQFGGNGDLSKWRDVFTSQTDYGHAKTSDVWTHHRMLPGPGKRRLTNPAELSRDDVGITIKHLLNMRDPYERALYDLVKQGKLGWSSGAPSHLVERKDIGEGRHEITSWILGADSSYTPCPAGGFGVDARAVKSLFDDAGIDLLAAIYEEPQAETKAADDTHARALLLELELLELEAIASTAV